MRTVSNAVTRRAAALLLALVIALPGVGFAAETKVVTPKELWTLFDKLRIPVYPYEARRARITGSRLFRMYVNPDGSVRTVGVNEEHWEQDSRSGGCRRPISFPLEAVGPPPRNRYAGHLYDDSLSASQQRPKFLANALHYR